MSEDRPQSYRDLIVWQKAMDMAFGVFELVKRFPREELYALRSQVTRAASSVPANIAEGNARGTTKDYANFLSIAKGSLSEMETLLLLAVRLEYLGQSDVAPVFGLAEEVGKMLTTLRSKLR
jgi:four helix bundle protein